MKYYTLAEHHTFCVESGIPGVEVWREVVKLGWLPEGIYHDPEKGFNPKQKEKQKEYNRKYRATPEGKAKKKEYQSTPEYKEKQKKYKSTPEYKEWRKEWNKRYRRNKK